jgi:acyl carrier protein phosphodiesterase
VNFLAHALLAGDDPALIAGGVAGDWIKGTLPAGLPHDLARGVALHRAIDHHAESHPAFCRSRARVSAGSRRYAGILVDMFYDHLLARDWHDHHHQPLPTYCAAVYTQIAARLPDLPEHTHVGLRLMANEDWLSSYAHMEGIAAILARMSRRTRQPNPLLAGERELLADLAGFEQDFAEWLADTREFCAAWRLQRPLRRGE